MEDNDFQKLKEVIRAYKDRKDSTKIQIDQLYQDFLNQRRYSWQVEILVDNLRKDLYSTPEREKVSELSKRASVDLEFEKYLRSAHSEIFFNRVIDPKDL